MENLAADIPLHILVDDRHLIDADELDLGDIDALRLFPTARGGVLMAPTGFSDGGAIGISGRLSEEQRANPRAGRGLLGIAGELREIQIPL